MAVADGERTKNPAPRPDRLTRASAFLAALWGFAEATRFFIVPDVLVSVIALRRGPKAALLAALIAALAAVPGGLLMYAFADAAPAAARDALVGLPAIDAAMVERTADDFAAGGWFAMLAGAFSGVPYKIYAVLAGKRQLPLAAFILLTPLVRLPRFALTALLTAGVARAVGQRLSRRGLAVALTLFWIVFYGFYFAAMPA